MNKLLQLLKLKPVRIALTILALGVASYFGIDTKLVQDLMGSDPTVSVPVAPAAPAAGPDAGK